VAYIYSSDNNTAMDYQELLQGNNNGFLVDLIAQNAIPETNFNLTGRSSSGRKPEATTNGEMRMETSLTN
jgi:hypothetical protein